MRAGAITLAIDSRIENVFLVGLAVNKICASIPLSEQAAYEAEVSVVEAVNNVIKHAYGSEAGHRVEVVVTVGAEAVTFEVCDTGRALEKLAVRLPPVDCDDRAGLQEGGRGLYIMHAFSDRVRYHSSGGRNVLTLVKLYPGAAMAPSASVNPAVAAAPRARPAGTAAPAAKIRKTR
ncbi:ATP-binding protein [Candidatus Binatia bacterium]|nr:ATP-binding protein [Candidatus Binatia bacterium]